MPWPSYSWYLRSLYYNFNELLKTSKEEVNLILSAENVELIHKKSYFDPLSETGKRLRHGIVGIRSIYLTWMHPLTLIREKIILISSRLCIWKISMNSEDILQRSKISQSSISSRKSFDVQILKLKVLGQCCVGRRLHRCWWRFMLVTTLRS